MQRGRKREKARLSARFPDAIDRAAIRAGKGSSDAYLSEWRRISSSIDSDAELREIAKQEVSRLESEFSDELLLQMIRNHGTVREQ